MSCIVCDKPATFRITVDLDIRGMGVCEEHKEEVGRDFSLALLSAKMMKRFETKYFPDEKGVSNKYI